MLARLGALLAIGLGGLMTVLPGADAHDASQQMAVHSGAQASLLSPEPMSGERFAAFYAMAPR